MLLLTKPRILLTATMLSLVFSMGGELNAQEGSDAAIESGINFFIDLEQNSKIEGVVVDMQKLKVTTGFGEVEVPLDKIDGIRLNAMDDGSAVMAFKNGDILTGSLHMNDLKLKTSWGFATVNVVYINQISTVKGSSFSSAVSNGKRTWTFSRGNGR